MAIFIVCYLNSFVKHSIVSIIIWCSMHIPPANILPIFFFYSFYNFGLVSETHDRQHILIYKLKTQNTHLKSITLWRFRPFIIHSTHSRIQLVVVSHRTQTEKNIQNPGSRLRGGSVRGSHGLIAYGDMAPNWLSLHWRHLVEKAIFTLSFLLFHPAGENTLTTWTPALFELNNSSLVPIRTVF